MSMNTVTRVKRGVVYALLSCALVACATVGKEFPEGNISKIVLEQTTQSDVKQLFGAPWRVGSESGQTTWTYGQYQYSAFSDAKTKDLVIRFNAQGKVVSYTFNTTQHDE